MAATKAGTPRSEAGGAERLRRGARATAQARPAAQEGRGHRATPRLVVNRSSRHIHVQLVDDLTGTTLAAASSIEADVRAVEGDKKAHSVRVGQLIAERAKAAGIETVVFDRGGYTYGGRIAALADAAREGGLKF